MKPLKIYLIIIISAIDLFPQSDSVLKFIFVPHPRSEDHVNLSVNPEIAKIDFPNYDVRLLGGDLTYNTNRDSATLVHCDNIFDLGSPNTLWSLGNHDVQSGDREIIKEFTGRESYYSYTRDRITFIVLDTELNAEGSSRTFIKDDQLKMVQDVFDSIKNSRYLILLHHRFMWMINNDDFKDRLTDSIAQSSRLLDTTNFYSDIYPLLQQVKHKGIQVLVFGGDRCDFNLEYSPEDSITFYAAGLSQNLPDSLDSLIVINYNLKNKEISCNFVRLFDVITSVVQTSSNLPKQFMLYQNYPNPFNPTTKIRYSIPAVRTSFPSTSGGMKFIKLKVYDILGNEITTLVNEEKPTGNYDVEFDGSNLPSGVYFYRLQAGNFINTKKFILLK
jgi:hypothetical protein